MEFVYFFKSGDKVKIGRTKDVSARLEAIRTSCPDGVENLGCIAVKDSSRLEQDIQYKYRRFRANGEWFEISEDEVNKILDKYGRHNSKQPNNKLRQEYDGLYWERIRSEYENSGMTLREFSILKNIKLGTLKSRKSREGWKDAKVKKKEVKLIDTISLEEQSDKSELIIHSLAVLINEDETAERKKAATMLLDYLLPEWQEVINKTA